MSARSEPYIGIIIPFINKNNTLNNGEIILNIESFRSHLGKEDSQIVSQLLKGLL